MSVSKLVLNRLFYDAYLQAGSLYSRSGASRFVGPRGRFLADQIDALVRRSLYPKLPTVHVIDGLIIHHQSDGYFGIELASGRYEPWTSGLFRRLILPDMRIVDVGAHVGYYSLIASTVLDERGALYAFEPDPVTFRYLERNVYLRGTPAKTTLVPKAVSNEIGWTVLYGGRRDPMTSSIFATPGARKDAIPCEVTTLDSFFMQEGWPHVDLVKIDVEGAEHAVLQGMSELSARSPNLKMIIEFLPNNLTSVGVTPHQFFSTLLGLGFSRVSVIKEQMETLEIPRDVPDLARRCGNSFVNLLCEKGTAA